MGDKTDLLIFSKKPLDLLENFFDHPEKSRDFKKVIKKDPNCQICIKLVFLKNLFLYLKFLSHKLQMWDYG